MAPTEAMDLDVINAFEQASATCYNCRKQGHYAHNCPEPRVMRNGGRTGNPRPPQSRDVVRKEGGRRQGPSRNTRDRGRRVLQVEHRDDDDDLESQVADDVSIRDYTSDNERGAPSVMENSILQVCATGPGLPMYTDRLYLYSTADRPFMRLEQIKEELVVLVSSLAQDDEMNFEDEQVWARWQPVLAGSDSVTPTLPLPTLSLRLAPDVQLVAEYLDEPELPDFSLQCLTLGRKEQASLRAQLEHALEQVQREESQLPVFTVFTALQEYLSANPPQGLPSRAGSAEAEAPRAPSAGPFQLKTTLLWSHHLLATSKRKDIVAWSTELSLYGLSKPGYPGVIVVEGLASSVDEFVYRIKQLQWKALQVRCEIDGGRVEAATLEEEQVSVKEAPVWVVRRKSHLGPILDPLGSDKVCVREVEGLNEVGEIMRRAGLEDVFFTALKLNK